MKKIFVLLFLFTYIHATAQEQFRSQSYLGISQGLNMSRANFDPSIQGMFASSTDQNFISGYNGGIVFIYYSEPNRAIQMELNYSRRGWAESLDSINSYNRKLDYIEFPFLSRFDIDLKKLRLLFILGPTVSYQISGKESINISDEDKVKEYYSMEIDNKLEGGLCLGIGVSRMTRTGIIQLECRLNQSLSNMFSEESDFAFSASQNQVIGVKVSYLFGMKK